MKKETVMSLRAGIGQFKAENAELLMSGDAWAVQELRRREELLTKESQDAHTTVREDAG